MSAKSKTGFEVQPSSTYESGGSKSTYVSDPQKSLHKIVIYTSQIEQGEIDLSGDFEGDWKQLAHFPKSGIPGRALDIKPCCDVDRQHREEDQHQTSALGNTDSAGG